MNTNTTISKQRYDSNFLSKTIDADVLVVYTLFLAFGFPGKYETFMPSSLVTIIEYSAFVLQIILMLTYTDTPIRDVKDIKLISLKGCFASIYMLLFAYFFNSMLVTSMPKKEFISCMRFTITGFFAIWMAEHYSPKRILELLYYGQCVFIISTILLFIISPNLCYSYEMNGLPSFCGLYDRKNTCCAELAAGLVIQSALIKVKRHDKEPLTMGFLFIYVVQIFMMFFCNATGATMSFVLVFIYIVFWNEKRTKLPVGLIFTSISAIFPFFFLAILRIFEPILNMLGKDITLSNRTTMWPVFIDIMLETHTLTGFGFNMFWRDQYCLSLYHQHFAKDTWFSTMATGAHNTVLELWLNVGLIGVALFLLMHLISFWNIKKADFNTYVLCSSFAFLLMLRGLTERSITPNNFQTIMMFVSCAVAAKVVVNKKQQT